MRTGIKKQGFHGRPKKSRGKNVGWGKIIVATQKFITYYSSIYLESNQKKGRNLDWIWACWWRFTKKIF